MTATALKPQHQKFVSELLVDYNLTRAYKAAGYRVKSNTVAAINASRLLKNANVAAFLKTRQQKLADKFEVTQERVIREYARCAFLDVRKMFNENGTFKDMKDLGDDEAAAIAGFDVIELFDKEGKKEGELKKVKLVSKQSCLQDLARHLGLFGDEVTIRLTIAELRAMPLDEKKRLLRQLEENRNN